MRLNEMLSAFLVNCESSSPTSSKQSIITLLHWPKEGSMYDDEDIWLDLWRSEIGRNLVKNEDLFTI